MAEKGEQAPARKEAASDSEAAAPAEGRALTRRELLAEHFLAALATAGDFTSDEDVIFYVPEPYGAVFELLKKGERKSSDPDLDRRMETILLVGEDLSKAERDDLKEQIRKEYLRERREEIAAEVRRAESMGDDAALQKALKEMTELPSK